MQEWLGYQFKDTSLLERAIAPPNQYNRGYQRLEFVGDSLISAVLSCVLYKQFEDLEEGRLTQLRSLLVSNEALGALASPLEPILYQSKKGSELSRHYLANVVEAMVAAVYLDSDLTQTQDCILRLFKKALQDLDLDSMTLDPKSRLQIYLQKSKQPLPSYTFVKSDQSSECTEEGEWIVEGRSNHLSATAKGYSKKQAEQKVAAKILLQLGEDVAKNE